jgi:hypothetical protein
MVRESVLVTRQRVAEPPRKDLTMPIGGFLNAFPSVIFIAAHIAFLIVGVWAYRRAGADKRAFAPALSLYVISQVVFLGYFAGGITMKMAVLIEQTLMVILMAAIAARRPASEP